MPISSCLRLLTVAAVLLVAACGGGEPPPPSPLADHPLYAPGERLYAQACLVCHQRDGRGAPGIQPSLVGPPVLEDTDRLIEIVLLGQDAFDPAASEYTGQMPAFSYFSDEQVAAVLTYVRGSFGNAGEPVAPAEVAAAREVVLAR